TADAVRELQAKYKTEREAAVKSGAADKVSAEAMKQAELFAKKADAALAAGRLIEAADSYRDARWLLPALPSDLPEHVTRVLGSARMRHADRIEDVTYN